MRRVGLVALVSAMLGAVASCASSPPLHYYTLTAVPAAGRLTVADNSVPIRIDRVTIAGELDRSQLVRRVDATRLQIVENDRWAAPLDDMIRRVLSDDLAARLPPGLVANPNEPAVGETRRSLTIDISDFYGDATCAVTLRAAWVLKQGDSQGSRGTEEVKVPGGGDCSGSGGLPVAMSQALGQLSDKIAAAVVAGSQ